MNCKTFSDKINKEKLKRSSTYIPGWNQLGKDKFLQEIHSAKKTN